jgi:hypothetical protein
VSARSRASTASQPHSAISSIPIDAISSEIKCEGLRPRVFRAPHAKL